ncbi:uncharacterized protein LOC127446226 [Myxocyprinus asiaticus]|uniref:uncharacterized protein LOC127446226 n=1 Tax=Myxocyprinus asiaticus TaxID=70543 RepID=UPI002222B554|nr:uncharacterized protein LOC127446226 [Myxocyprinus asiaticus]XP_051562944.1 uncharacterized protein LOC127446226 [Myxocyprinus asiaticus]
MGITTVQNLGRIVAIKGERRVRSMTSAERGTLVTMALAGNALSNIIPPHFVFPRIKYLPHFIRDSSVGSTGTANGSGWMQELDFVDFLQHSVHHTRATEDIKVLLILDNHSSLVSIEAINFCWQNGVVLLSFQPHFTHHLQPLDRTVHGLLKKHLKSEMDKWHRKHPGTTITIYDLPEMVNNILLLAALPQNVQQGFRCTGPFNRETFSENNFLPASVTDRPSPGPASDAPAASPIRPSTAASTVHHVSSMALPVPQKKQQLLTQRA